MDEATVPLKLENENLKLEMSSCFYFGSNQFWNEKKTRKQKLYRYTWLKFQFFFVFFELPFIEILNRLHICSFQHMFTISRFFSLWHGKYDSVYTTRELAKTQFNQSLNLKPSITEVLRTCHFILTKQQNRVYFFFNFKCFSHVQSTNTKWRLRKAPTQSGLSLNIHSVQFCG